MPVPTNSFTDSDIPALCPEAEALRAELGKAQAEMSLLRRQNAVLKLVPDLLRIAQAPHVMEEVLFEEEEFAQFADIVSRCGQRLDGWESHAIDRAIEQQIGRHEEEESYRFR